MTPEQARDMTERLRLYAQPQRLAILTTLLSGALSVGAIETRTGIRQPTLSQQLGELRRAEILAMSRDARAVFYDYSNATERNRAKTLLALFNATTAPVPMPLESPEDARMSSGGASFARIMPNNAPNDHRR